MPVRPIISRLQSYRRFVSIIGAVMEEFDYLQYSLLSEHIAAEQKSARAWAHNDSVAEIEQVGEAILDFSLAAVAQDRLLLQQEGAVNSAIRRHLIDSGFGLYTKDKSGACFFQLGNDITPASDFPVSSDSIPDVIFDRDGKRIELKTTALFVSKSAIPEDFFSKDLDQLTDRDQEQERNHWEGASRDYRNTEMALIIGDRDIIVRDKKLQALLGKKFWAEPGLSHNRHTGLDGTCFIVRSARYDRPLSSTDKKGNSRAILEAMAVLAFPARKDW